MKYHKCTDSEGTVRLCVCPIDHDHTDEEFYQAEVNQK